MAMHVVSFRVNLNEEQFQSFLVSLRPYLPDASRLELFIRKHSPVSRVALMRHGKFTANEIDIALKTLRDNLDIETRPKPKGKGKGSDTFYIWKESATPEKS